MNLFLDAPIPQPRAEIAASPVIPENWLCGHRNITCANGPHRSPRRRGLRGVGIA